MLFFLAKRTPNKNEWKSYLKMESVGEKNGKQVE